MESRTACEGASEQTAKGKAIPIVVPREDGSLMVDLKALESILLKDEIKELPVSLISIAGALRTGKSFLLNTLLGWLNENEKNGQVDDNWLLNMAGTFTDGFHWRGGADLDTEGILMWSKPFILMKEEMKVAVLLIDTQGNFDHGSKQEISYRIFALSTLLSSVQNYNVSNRLQADTFDHLQAFLTYTRTCKSDESFPFQALKFIVRDWPNQHQYGYGKDGGNQYLDKFWSRCLDGLGNKSGPSIRGSFQRVDCYLLPFPGSTVSTCQSGDVLCLEDADRKFLSEVQNLAKKTFSSEDLTLKRIDGKVVTAGILYKYVERWDKSLHDDHLPSIHTLTELIIKDHCTERTEDTLERFEAFFLSVNEGTFVEWKEFDDMVDNEITKCKQYFLESTPYGRGAPLHNESVERLRTILLERKTQLEVKNRENQYPYMEEKCQQLLEEHKTALDKDNSFFTCWRSLGETHRSFLAKLRTLREDSIDSRRHRSVSLSLENCKEKMENYYQDLKSSRNTTLAGAATAGSALIATAGIIFVLAGGRISAVSTIVPEQLATKLPRALRWQ